jgi:hypothetical protein
MQVTTATNRNRDVAVRYLSSRSCCSPTIDADVVSLSRQAGLFLHEPKEEESSLTSPSADSLNLPLLSPAIEIGVTSLLNLNVPSPQPLLPLPLPVPLASAIDNSWMPTPSAYPPLPPLPAPPAPGSFDELLARTAHVTYSSSAAPIPPSEASTSDGLLFFPDLGQDLASFLQGDAFEYGNQAFWSY